MRALIAVDHDDDVAVLKPLMTQWAKDGLSHVIVVGVVPTLSASILSKQASAMVRNVEAKTLQEVRSRIEGFLDALDVPSEFHMLSGKASEEIVKAAVLHSADVVIKTADRPLGEKLPVFGAVEKKLIRKCPVPVWIVHYERTQAPRKIAVAIDNPAHASDPDAAQLLGASLLKHAVELAHRFKAPEIVVIHAWSAAGIGFLDNPRARLSAQDIEIYIREYEEVSESWLSGFVKDANARYSGQDIHFIPALTMGEPLDAIPQALEQAKAELLVLGSANRTGVQGLFIGNTAEGLIERAACSVYVVKPEGVSALLAPAAA